MKRKVGIIGLGYVGLPLAMLFHAKGFHVVGIDADQDKLALLQKGTSYLRTVTDEEIVMLNQSAAFQYTHDHSEIKDTEAIIICVPTPLTEKKKPNLTFIKQAVLAIRPYTDEGKVVVLESSTYPGTTEDMLKPLLEEDGKRVVGTDVYLGHSPERIDPGNDYALDKIPKVVSGVTAACLQKVKSIYEPVFETLVPVQSAKIAEMTKLLENTQRFVNISFMNEMSRICHHFDLDLWEVVQAASTKPFGFSPYYPSLGVGGHCIPVDPLYLKWHADQHHIPAEFIDLAKKIDDEQPSYVADRLLELLPDTKQPLDIVLIGVTYKPNVNDIRESKAIPLFQLLNKSGCQVHYHDPYISEIMIDGELHKSVPLTKQVLQNADCAVILSNHHSIDYAKLLQYAPLIFDTRNCYAAHYDHVHRL